MAASAAQILELRGKIDEPNNTAPYTDTELGAEIDTAKTVDQAAYNIWVRKAASFAKLVNISESGSSRQMSDLYKNALSMADRFGTDESDLDVPLSQRARTRKIQRR